MSQKLPKELNDEEISKIIGVKEASIHKNVNEKLFKCSCGSESFTKFHNQIKCANCNNIYNEDTEHIYNIIELREVANPQSNTKVIIDIIIAIASIPIISYIPFLAIIPFVYGLSITKDRIWNGIFIIVWSVVLFIVAFSWWSNYRATYGY
ncbi:MAG: hypothetical protein LBT66_04360 [Methanobrevibacter sp.]|jgi:hypothetical protein|nr:hypothetical protein [Candidatus Methanovirga meridionalis]